MTLGEANIDDSAASARIALDGAAETATLTFPQPLAAGPHKLRITFKAQINKFARGMFLVEYPTENGMRRMISSHLEPADARRVFPCWDEPAFKASIALTVTVPRSFLAVGNMPVAREEPVTPTLKQVAFAATPKMSTYLFVLTAGELERLSGQADGVTIGIVTAAGKRDQGGSALDSAVNLLRYFNDYLRISSERMQIAQATTPCLRSPARAPIPTSGCDITRRRRARATLRSRARRLLSRSRTSCRRR
jgi:aminopeptidase N